MIFMHNEDVTLHDAIVSATNGVGLQVLINSLSDDSSEICLVSSQKVRQAPITRSGGSI